MANCRWSSIFRRASAATCGVVTGRRSACGSMAPCLPRVKRYGLRPGMHLEYVQRGRFENTGVSTGIPCQHRFRFRYNQDVKSIYAMVPAVIPILLIFIPAILMALGVVREKELGRSPTSTSRRSRGHEFLIGKAVALHRSGADQLRVAGDPVADHVPCADLAAACWP